MKFLITSQIVYAFTFGSFSFAQSTKHISQVKLSPLGESNDTAASGEWWKKKFDGKQSWMNLKVPRDEVICFALYTAHENTLKLTAQFYPLMPDEPRSAVLEIERDGKWEEIATSEIHELGWSAHFRVENWDQTKNVKYRVKYNEKATFAGLVRKDPVDKELITVASLSCNSRKDRGDRENIVRNIKHKNPDLLFFAGDQSYDHKEHTAAWLLFGRQFREVMRDRPTITIPDDHDVGQANLWGEGGKVSKLKGGADGGYALPAEYVKMVERCQTWHLPDAYDPKPIQQGIGVYYTSINLGEISFAIIEDRKWKTGPAGKIPQQGPRPDHIRNPKYDPKSVDLEGLELLGDRQHKFIYEWAQDWQGAEMKAVLSQTPFAGAVTQHGNIKNRLHADMDCNGWPQTQRNKALTEIRKAWAVHLCGDQHLGMTFQNGIENWNDGPYCHSSCAIVNTIYSRYWMPENDAAGKNRSAQDVLPFTGEYLDGFANKFTMRAYANPKKDKDAGGGFALVYFDKSNRNITFENWPVSADISKGDKPYPGWPITIRQRENDGRTVVGNLGSITVENVENPVYQVVSEDTKEILYTVRAKGNTFTPEVYSEGTYTINVGIDKPNIKFLTGRKIGSKPTKILIK